MQDKKVEETLEQKKQDADELIKEVLKKIPSERKIEALRILEGFMLSTSSEKVS